MGDQDFDDVPNNSAAWVRSIASMYNVPARIGGAIRYTGGKAPRFGTIKGASGGRLLIVLDGETAERSYHPTWEIHYLEDERGQS